MAQMISQLVSKPNTGSEMTKFTGIVAMSLFTKKLANYLLVVSSLLLVSTHSVAQEFFAPPQEKGKLVVVLSGASGPERYKDFSQSISQLGYSVLLLDGRDVPPIGGFSASNLKRFISEAQKNPKIISGDLVVIGLSLGGGGALVNAVQGENGIKGVIAMYPAIAKISLKSVAINYVQVPTLILAGEKDTFNNCCLIEYMNEYYDAAKQSGKKIELITFPNAGHGFNLKSAGGYKETEAKESFSHIKGFLQKYLPAD